MMGMMTCISNEKACWICGRKSALTGEHKIKRTDLERFPVCYPTFRLLGQKKDKIIQGYNSKLLKYNNSICKDCNNSRTQGADRRYEAFMLKEVGSIESTVNVKNLTISQGSFVEIDLKKDSDLARYFGKHLGCALRYQGFPIPRRLSRFVCGDSHSVCIKTTKRVAPLYWISEDGIVGPLTALGGAFVKLRDDFRYLPQRYQSAFMTCGIQFCVSMELSFLEAIEIAWRVKGNSKFRLQNFNDEEAIYRGVQ